MAALKAEQKVVTKAASMAASMVELMVASKAQQMVALKAASMAANSVEL